MLQNRRIHFAGEDARHADAVLASSPPIAVAKAVAANFEAL